MSVKLSASLFLLHFPGILKLYETVLTNQECTATAAQFLTRLPEDLGADALFRAIASVRTSAHKRTFTQILQAHMDAAASHSVWFPADVNCSLLLLFLYLLVDFFMVYMLVLAVTEKAEIRKLRRVKDYELCDRLSCVKKHFFLWSDSGSQFVSSYYGIWVFM